MFATHRIRIRLFAQARDILGTGEIYVDCDGPASAGELRSRLADLHPDLALLLSRSALAVNLEYVDDARPVKPGDEVAVVPPVAGG
jgi:molybdopterin converting factor small subunit